ncbi:brain-specific angiogenesis inhibitor 1-associated protein 2-like protein 2 [Platysternon megacephalum]|uniref:Enoyl-CoA hydratase, mitochondrial n=1 Tax=Platysternon megacephalum TaxID=55544 RepID=A0A4D9EQC8_9SAUR|nr:brain-specific angiogenesis inhibitor 1-associated protein 2-like protein 2 [Platysternon megacephalum]
MAVPLRALLCPTQAPAHLLLRAPARLCLAGTQFQYLVVEKKGEKQNVGVIQLNHPKALNALCDGLMNEMNQALNDFEDDPHIGAIVITGSEKAFAAGADIKGDADQNFPGMLRGQFPCTLEQSLSGQEASHSSCEWIFSGQWL